jgi:hypothetical protein
LRSIAALTSIAPELFPMKRCSRIIPTESFSSCAQRG